MNLNSTKRRIQGKTFNIVTDWQLVFSEQGEEILKHIVHQASNGIFRNRAQAI